jgi:prepilin-type N-terminal cleavage/methylation domain-containing protein
MDNNFLKDKRGFTLVEMLVVCSVLAILLVAVINIFVSALKSERYILASQVLIDQGNYAMEYMSRSLRMAKKDDGICGIGANLTYKYPAAYGLMFEKYDGTVCKGIYLENGRLYEYDSGHAATPSFLTSSKIEVTSFQVNIMDGAGVQPRVTVYLELKNKGADPQPSIKLQTTISQRNLNF